MSVYVGIDVHRKRSQVAVIDQDGKVLANRNVNNGVTPILSVIGGLPPGTPAAFEAAYGWGWLVELLEDYGFEPHLVHPLQCKAIASARLKNDKVDAAILAQLLRADLLPEAWIAPPAVRQLRALLRHRAQLVRLRTLLQNRLHAVLADHGHDRPAGCWSGPGREWLASLDLPAVSAEVVSDALALTGSLESVTGRPRRRGPPARQVRPAGQGPHHAAWCRPVHRSGPAGRDRRHHPVRLGAQAGVLGRAHPDRPRLEPHRPARAHLQAGAGLGPVGLVRGRAEGQAASRLRRQLPVHRPDGGASRSPPPRSPASCSPAPITCSPTPPAPVRPASREGRQPRVSSRDRMSRPGRARCPD